MAGVYDRNADTALLYVNGTLVASGAGGISVMNPTADLFVGRYFGHFLNGQIDEVRIWNLVRTEEELQDAMTNCIIGNELGLVGYWRFDEIAGQALFDSSPNGNTGILGATNDVASDDPARVPSTAPSGCADSDGDGLVDVVDNCPDDYNNDQADSDVDRIGNACDNCPFANPDQLDDNSNGIGDVCDEFIALLLPFLPEGPPGPTGPPGPQGEQGPPGPLIPACPDQDGDAWADCSRVPVCHPYGHPCGDCDDADATVNPGAVEDEPNDHKHDGKDNDCNGEIDDF